MLETELRELFERQVSGRERPAAITSQQVIRQGRARLRIRRAGAVAAPLIAAAAVVAIVVSATPPRALPGRSRHPESTQPTVAAAPEYFDPARLYPAFGWLPAGIQVFSGGTGTVSQTLEAGQPGGLADWTLTVYARGQCSTTGRTLRCKGESALSAVPMTMRLPNINGLPAYSTVGAAQRILVFEYAGDGWAELTFTDQAEAVRIAEHVAFGSSAARVVFPVQLTGLPGWQLRYAYLPPAPQGTPLQAGMLVFAKAAGIDAPGPGILDDYPVLTITMAGPCGICYSGSGPGPQLTGSHSTRSVISGYTVTITRGTAASPPARSSRDGHGSAVQELYAADADGLTINIVVEGNRPAIDVTQLFAHLRLLGPNPAHWTAKPVA